MTPKKTGRKPVTSEYIVVRRSRIHGTGVYARKDVPKGARVIEYTGEKVTKKESDRRSRLPLENNADNPEMGAVYLFELNKRYDVDGYVDFNTARLINHSCDPNCESDIIRGKIWIIALRDIKKGEELTYNYNYGWEDYEDHECQCGTYRCVGYILNEEHWRKLFRRLRKETKRVSLKKWQRIKRKFVLS